MDNFGYTEITSSGIGGSHDTILHCQELIKIGKFGGRVKTPETFSPGDERDLSWKKNEFAKQYRL